MWVLSAFDLSKNMHIFLDKSILSLIVQKYRDKEAVLINKKIRDYDSVINLAFQPQSKKTWYYAEILRDKMLICILDRLHKYTFRKKYFFVQKTHYFNIVNYFSRKNKRKTDSY